MAAFDQSTLIQAPPSIVWQEALGFARKGRVVREDAHRFLVATQLKYAFAYLLEQQADGSTCLRHVIDRESKIDKALRDHPDPTSALNALTSGEASPAQEALSSALGAALDVEMPGMSSMLQGEERLKRIRKNAERAAQRAHWMPAPAPIHPPSPTVEPSRPATLAEMASLATPATSDVLPPTGRPPWDPKLFAAMAFLFSFGASGILAGLNWRRLGKSQLALPTIAISLAGLAGFLALVTQLAENPATLVGYVVNIGIGALLTYWQLPAYRSWVATYGQTTTKNSGWLIPTLVGLGTGGAVLALLIVPPLLQTNAAVQHFSRGNDYLDREQYASAVEEFTQVIEIDPERAEAYHNRGLAYSRMGDAEHAIADWSKALSIQEDASTYSLRGATYSDRGDYQLALADLDKALALDPQLFEAYHDRGLTYGRMGDYERALADLSKALSIQEDADTYAIRGDTYRLTEDYDRALADFDKALELNPDYANAYRLRGLTYAMQDDLDLAMTDLEKAIALNPRDAEAFFLCGLIHIDRAEREDAVADLNKALELGLNPEAEQVAQDALQQLTD